MRKSVRFAAAMSACLLIFIGMTHAQDPVREDTVKIGDVLVTVVRADGETGYRKTVISSDQLRGNLSQPLSCLLEAFTSLTIKDYGQGGLATSAFRGMGPNHTAVLWEGIRINPSMTGQVDFSLVPTSFADKVTVYHGGAAGEIPQGGPGGTVSITSVTQWKNGTGIDLRSDWGSFGSWSGQAAITTGTADIQYSARFINSYSRNDFTYTDDLNYLPSREVRRENASLLSRGTLQSLAYRKGNTIASARVWYTYSHRMLPGSLAWPSEGNEEQYDESLRTMVSVKNYSTPWSLELKAALVSDWLRYIYRTWDTDSRNKSDRIVVAAIAGRDFSKNIGLKLVVNENIDFVRSVNYSSRKQRRNLDMNMMVSGRLSDRIGVLLQLKEQVSDGEFFVPEPSIGLDVRLLNKRNYFIKGNIGRSLHLPGMNDLYWNPGGNEELLNEEGVNGEITLALDESSGSRAGIRTELTLYRSKVTNMIKWLPGSDYYWVPVNVAAVNSKGVEASVDSYLALGKGKIHLSALYSYTDAAGSASGAGNDGADGKQLIYVPRHRGSFRISYDARRIRISSTTSLNGLQYTDPMNTITLPAYSVTGLAATYSMNIGSSLMEVTLRSDNVFNRSYQKIEHYPMPGRSFSAGLRYNFHN